MIVEERHAWRRKVVSHPARILVLVFAAFIAVGSVALWMPFAHRGGQVPFLDAVFTATSATCVTGLATIPTSEWSGFGQVVLVVLMQLGGFGLMAMASVTLMLFSQRIGLRQRIIARTETGVSELGDVRSMLRTLSIVTLAIEATAAVVLTVRFVSAHDQTWPSALWNGIFHAVSAFNNAGFARWDDSLAGFAHDWIVLGVIGLSVIIGGLGFPVFAELRVRGFNWDNWSLHAKLVLVVTPVLLLAGAVGIALLEWTNPLTLGSESVGAKAGLSVFSSAMTRTAGFEAVPHSGMGEATWFLIDILMFVGAGSASTAGGIKVGTLAVLACIVWAEVKGNPDVVAFRRRIPTQVQRQAIAIAGIAAAVVTMATFLLAAEGNVPMAEGLFEALSALGTVGLSTGVTTSLSVASEVTLIVLMFMGRAGTITFGAALVAHQHSRAFRWPEEAPIVG
ncbi:MAG: TrkH family potassium uptake protein [Acidimicrobiia bacterium]|jgi:trk system potassium uptake protein TrkH|nr:TrkH family potassium uptake protein [Acidimicrobiia bacterium]